MQPATPEEQVAIVIEELWKIVYDDPGVADKVEDAIAGLDEALKELDKNPPDNQAAAGKIEGAIGDLEAAVDDGLITKDGGEYLMNQLAGINRQLVVDAMVLVQGGDSDAMYDAKESLAEGDDLVKQGAFKDAASKYKDALAQAESALS